MNSNPEHLEPLIGALREELQQYGEMLVLLDRQQEQVKARSASDIFQSISLIQAQAATIQNAREQREACRRTTARECQQPENTTFARLIPCLPSDYRPLLAALVEENNHLLTRVRDRARQNHLLLRRSVDLMRELMRALFPSRQSSVYNGNGHKRVPALSARSLYNAVG